MDEIYGFTDPAWSRSSISVEADGDSLYLHGDNGPDTTGIMLPLEEAVKLCDALAKWIDGGTPTPSPQ